jgi:hypothetical protein
MQFSRAKIYLNGTTFNYCREKKNNKFVIIFKKLNPSNTINYH